MQISRMLSVTDIKMRDIFFLFKPPLRKEQLYPTAHKFGTTLQNSATISFHFATLQKYLALLHSDLATLYSTFVEWSRYS